MRRKFVKKGIALALSVAIIGTGNGIFILGETVQAATREVKEYTEKNQETEQQNTQLEIVKELKKERTENTNTYLMSDGSKKLEVYATDIRYKEGGKWKTYDSSLTDISKSESKVLESVCSDENIDIEEYIYTNVQGKYKQYFANNISEKTPVIMTNDKYQIRFSPITEGSSAGETENPEKISDGGKKDSNAQESETFDTGEYSITVESTNEEASELLYSDSDNSVSYEYISLSDGVKESIILNKRPEKNVFKFCLDIEEMSAVLNQDTKEIELKSIENGETKAVIQRPNITDAQNNLSYDDVDYNLIHKKEGYYELQVHVKESYLDKAQYPVIIDPTYGWSGTSMVDYGTTCSYGSAATTVASKTNQFVVENSSLDEQRIYMKFKNLNQEIRGKYIQYSSLRLCTKGVYGSVTVGVSDVLEDWDSTTLMYVNQPSISNDMYDTEEGSTPGTWSDFNLTDWAKKISSEEISNDYGLALTAEESEFGYIKYYSFKSTVDIPVLSVLYQDVTDIGCTYDGSFEINSETDENSVSLSWKKYSDETDEYDIYTRTDDSFNYIGHTTELSYDILTEYLGDTTDIRVIAIDKNNAEAYLSATNIASNIITIERETEVITDENNNTSTSVIYNQTVMDTDGDGLEDGYEIWDFKTYWNTKDDEGNYILDTDNDGFPDSYEVFTLGTDPAESNLDGVDSDGDGWTDLKEYQEGTDPWLYDSDFDGTNDRGDGTPRETNDYTWQSIAAAAEVDVRLYDRQYSETIDGVTYTYITNIYRGVIRQISVDYGNISLNKVLKYFYDERGNNTAIIEAYDKLYDPHHTQTICITYTYDDENNVTFICDQRTKYTMKYDADGEMTELQVGNQKLMTYAETELVNNEGTDGDTTDIEIGGIINQSEKKEIYENGQMVRIISTTYKVAEEDTISVATKLETYYNHDKKAAYVVTYNVDGEILKLQDYSDSLDNPVEITYSYTENGVLAIRSDGFTKSIETSENEDIGVYTISTLYRIKDLKGNSQAYTNTITSQTETETDADGVERNRSVISQTLHNNDTVSINSNKDSYVTKIHSDLYNTDIIKNTYTRENHTHIAYGIDIYANDKDKDIDYTYDLAGNITKIEIGNEVQYEYGYDAHGRIIIEKDYTVLKEYNYDYNTNGNIYGKTEYPIDSTGKRTDNDGITIHYTYGNGDWPDQLTKYNGETITYDNSGNPLTYVGGLTFTWSRGRQLSSITLADNSSVSYKYNENGLRIYKDTEESLTTYEWDGDTLIRETVIYKTTGQKVDIWYIYDANGSVIGFEYSYFNIAGNLTTARVYYEKNMQGDVIGLLDARGAEIATYTYDAWGNITHTEYINGNQMPCELNHITYRGYYRDEETGFYYLQSRYYDAEIGRFINADDISILNLKTSSIYKDNIYIYCNSNPVNYMDGTGEYLEYIWWGTKKVVRGCLHTANNVGRYFGVDTAKVGAFFLQMDKDQYGIYHAKFDCWQQYFGYNDLYDFMFDIGTSMKSYKADFTYNGISYRFWMWKGDYINLGAGAEIGFYTGRGIHWTVNKEKAMNLTMTVKYKGKQIIHYSSKTWWLTGFNPKYQNVNQKDLEVKYWIKFNDTGMYNAFKNRKLKSWTFYEISKTAVYKFV